MHIAILVTNTDFSAFAGARPDDGVKFRLLLNEVRPNWTFGVFWVCRDEFPSRIDDFDGVLITGSPASTSDGEPWMNRLEKLVHEIIAAGQPLFGACFGHQIIAKALGAPVVKNPSGWGHGLLTVKRTKRMPWSGPGDTVALYGSHIEQVGKLPEGATTVFSGEGLPIAGFVVGNSVFAVQHHPEMTHEFISDLVEHYGDVVGEVVTNKARRSLSRKADREAFAEEIACFFEHSAEAGERN